MSKKKVNLGGREYPYKKDINVIMDFEESTKLSLFTMNFEAEGVSANYRAALELVYGCIESHYKRSETTPPTRDEVFEGVEIDELLEAFTQVANPTKKDAKPEDAKT